MDPENLQTLSCIAGGGPAGMMLGFLLARAGIDVIVLEKHKTVATTGAPRRIRLNHVTVKMLLWLQRQQDCRSIVRSDRR